MSCIFCDIIAGTEPASLIYEDDQCIAFMNIYPIHPGECMVIPKAHINHFTEIPDALSAHIMIVAQKIGRRMFDILNPAPKRIGYIVHGFGVPHAHLIIVPQHNEDDIISMRHLRVEEGEIFTDVKQNYIPSREELDELAAKLR